MRLHLVYDLKRFVELRLLKKLNFIIYFDYTDFVTAKYF